MKRLLLPLALASGLTACAATREALSPSACEIGAPAKMVQLFFGRSAASGIRVSDAAWQAFVDGVVTSSFPEGFTVLDAQGLWRDPQTRNVMQEHSKLIVVSVPTATVSIPVRVAPIIAAYKARFSQQSVGVVVTDACAAF
jgi:hypothetical protein